MEYIDEYRDPTTAQAYSQRIRETVTQPWTLMEVCGGQTHAIVRFGIDQLLPPELTLVHGPGCPVCVTPVELIDAAVELAQHPEVTLCSFGDMLRVPGTRGSLLSAQAAGAELQIVYSPLDALELARQHPDRQVVFFAVGFETTAPANAMAAYQAYKSGVENFWLLVSHVLVPPAMKAMLDSTENRVQGFLAAGHVCTVMGWTEYEPIAKRYNVPIVVTGFEPLDILQGILMCVRQLEEGRAEVENQYTRSVRRGGNEPAQQLVSQVFHVTPRNWRGIGLIAESGLALRPPYDVLDAMRRFKLSERCLNETTECISGLVLQGLKKPDECPAFGTRCTPDHPLGATMVSSEGACAAYFHYRPTRVPGQNDG